MKNQNTPLANQVENLTQHHLKTFNKDKVTGKDTVTINLPGGYVGLIGKIQSLILVSQSAVLSQDAIEYEHTQYDLANVLELAAELMPLEEAEYLDQMRSLFPKEIKKD